MKNLKKKILFPVETGSHQTDRKVRKVFKLSRFVPVGLTRKNGRFGLLEAKNR